MKEKELLEKPLLTKSEQNQAIEFALNQTQFSLNRFKDRFKHFYSTDGVYADAENNQWTTGFWSGQLWLAYEFTNDPIFSTTALDHVKSFRQRLENRVAVDTHDLGFLYTLSCVAAYKLTGDELAKETALLAADLLVSRFHEKGQFIQAWGVVGNVDNYRLIIDCLLNLPLLYWASDVSGKNLYRQKAEAHIHTSMKVLVRPNGSTYHTYYFDSETGEPVKGVTHQGYSASSAWARGQAWGVYGLALSYRYTRNPEYLALFEKVTQYYLSHLPKNLVPYWDFVFTDGSNEPRDSSASAIVVCGLYEIAKYLGPEKAEYYRNIGSRLMKSLFETCAVRDNTQSDGVLFHGVYGRKTEFNDCKNHGVDECNLWGDYYYMEALMRMQQDWVSYW